MAATHLEAVGAASFAVAFIYLAGELTATGVHALSATAEGAGKRARGVGSAVVQGIWFAVGTSALLAATLTRPAVLSAYFGLLVRHSSTCPFSPPNVETWLGSS